MKKRFGQRKFKACDKVNTNQKVLLDIERRFTFSARHALDVSEDIVVCVLLVINAYMLQISKYFY